MTLPQKIALILETGSDRPLSQEEVRELRNTERNCIAKPIRSMSFLIKRTKQTILTGTMTFVGKLTSWRLT
ncbi:hypothetical protein [Mechercharimyces sp. CAU 1602]|uniref:hypothetical protein n=1 Tax=Mechercharimyces sp. CAU 1602 TaxID=2973933 RepID=UPI0021621A39|nr:hypothetical protein [Mechercharimyces sp. CAU 1602]MCS1352424.1 hypothetical protein [Mechercharimyces sp. CAU 1602]